MRLHFEFQDRRVEESVKYSSLESRFLGDVFKSTAESENINNYDGMLVFVRTYPTFSHNILSFLNCSKFLFILSIMHVVREAIHVLLGSHNLICDIALNTIHLWFGALK